MIPVFFNLFANTVFSLLCGLLVVSFFIWLFRVETDRWLLLLISLPLIKVVYDFICGISEDSILHSTINPFFLPAKSQSLQLGLGLSYWSPQIMASFFIKDSTGQGFTITGGDYIFYWLTKQFGSAVPLSLLVFTIVVSSFFILSRFISWFFFEKKRRVEFFNCEPMQIKRIGLRSVPIYISKQFCGSPFAGGIFKPYICFPEETVAKLSKEEFNAVLAHELAHINNYDLIGTVFIQTLGDIFWFIPGYQWLSRKIDNLREVLADQSAVSAGVDPVILASALIKLKVVSPLSEGPVLYSAFFRDQSILKMRIERLLGVRTDKKSRWGWQFKGIRVIVSIIIGGAIINSSFVGNRKLLLGQSPEWFQNRVQKLNK